MAEKKLPVITINRLYAAYGTTIAEILSDRLGIPYYDKDFVRKTAAESDYELEEVEFRGEEISSRSKLINMILNTTVGTYPDMVRDLYVIQRKVIIELAQNECILLGRCANHILREIGVPTFDIFLYADIEHRRMHAAELEETQDKKDLDKYIAQRDTFRNNYYRTFVGTDIDDCRNYHICLDTGRITPNQCADIIIGLLENWK
ncbi:MAG: cytidylate kinase-like family protein [Lachnospiraceae bacterium]|nr:cytidylate kinase-like family protein [Lachnospiraceae bacterium]